MLFWEEIHRPLEPKGVCGPRTVTGHAVGLGYFLSLPQGWRAGAAAEGAPRGRPALPTSLSEAHQLGSLGKNLHPVTLVRGRSKEILLVLFPPVPALTPDALIVDQLPLAACTFWDGRAERNWAALGCGGSFLPHLSRGTWLLFPRALGHTDPPFCPLRSPEQNANMHSAARMLRVLLLLLGKWCVERGLTFPFLGWGGRSTASEKLGLASPLGLSPSRTHVSLRTDGFSHCDGTVRKAFGLLHSSCSWQMLLGLQRTRRFLWQKKLWGWDLDKSSFKLWLHCWQNRAS